MKKQVKKEDSQGQVLRRRRKVCSAQYNYNLWDLIITLPCTRSSIGRAFILRGDIISVGLIKVDWRLLFHFAKYNQVYCQIRGNSTKRKSNYYILLLSVNVHILS